MTIHWSSNVSGFHNTVLGGGGAGFNIVAGSINIYIDWGVSANGPFDESDAIRINGSAPQVGGTNSKVFVGGINAATVGGANVPVIINPKRPAWYRGLLGAVQEGY